MDSYFYKEVLKVGTEDLHDEIYSKLRINEDLDPYALEPPLNDNHSGEDIKINNNHLGTIAHNSKDVSIL